MDDDTTSARPPSAFPVKRPRRVPWLALGIGIGAAVGVATGAIALGVGIGAAIGAALTAVQRLR
ncbi:MAG TPA: hypothetical protein VGV61_05380 [Thermoanaerobaculia bacterium]|jgi:hypothetical protein|nr:hypothetical protein [Thermoanaerobaculia bacterium]